MGTKSDQLSGAREKQVSEQLDLSLCKEMEKQMKGKTLESFRNIIYLHCSRKVLCDAGNRNKNIRIREDEEVKNKSAYCSEKQMKQKKRG